MEGNFPLTSPNLDAGAQPSKDPSWEGVHAARDFLASIPWLPQTEGDGCDANSSTCPPESTEQIPMEKLQHALNAPNLIVAAQILELLAPLSDVERELTLAMVAANPQYRPNIAERDPWEASIHHYLVAATADGRNVGIADLLQSLSDRPLEEWTRADSNRVLALAQKLGWIYTRKRLPYGRERVYAFVRNEVRK